MFVLRRASEEHVTSPLTTKSPVTLTLLSSPTFSTVTTLLLSPILILKLFQTG